jgi:hypothetical protein
MATWRHKNEAPPAGWLTRITCTDCGPQCESGAGTPEAFIDEVLTGHSAQHVIEEAERAVGLR